MKIENKLKQAIRKKCIECCGSLSEARRCEMDDCPLFKYRLGKIKRESK